MTDQISLTQEQTDEKLGIVQYIAGELDGRDYWAYVLIKPSLFARYHEMVAEGREIELTDFGKIIEQGYDKEPPQEIRDRVVAEYADPGLEYKIALLGKKWFEMTEGDEDAVKN